jgi:hypothetical protein
MKLYVKIKWMILLLIIVYGCKHESMLSPQFSQAYTRFVIIDAPGTGNGKVQFYLDGKVNANGDSSIHNPDGTLYQPDPAQYSTSTINYPSGGWTDNSPINFAGTYGFSNNPGSTYATFPNPTDRIALAPIINNINYYNWSALTSAQHQLTFYSVINSSLFGNPISVKGDQFLSESINLEGGAIQTFFLVNKAVAKQYQTIENSNYNTGLPIYGVNESINYFSNQFDIVSVKDHPANLPKFKDSSAYIRFINVTPAFSDQSVNQNTQSLDIYIVPLYGLRPDIVSLFGSSNNYIDSIGQEVLVSKGLERYQSTVDAPFYEINVAANMRINKSTGKPDTATTPGKPRVPRYYRVLAYPSGQSKANGGIPIGIGDWLAVYNQFPGYDFSYPINGPTGVNVVDSWLLRSDGTNFHPSICTIPIAVSGYLYQGPSATGTSYYLGYRSCVDYQKAGINSVYFK